MKSAIVLTIPPDLADMLVKGSIQGMINRFDISDWTHPVYICVGNRIIAVCRIESKTSVHKGDLVSGQIQVIRGPSYSKSSWCYRITEIRTLDQPIPVADLGLEKNPVPFTYINGRTPIETRIEGESQMNAESEIESIQASVDTMRRAVEESLDTLTSKTAPGTPERERLDGIRARMEGRA